MRPCLVSGTTFRYFFTGFTGGTLSVTFLAGTWTARRHRRDRRRHHGRGGHEGLGDRRDDPETASTSTSRYRPTPGATVNALTVDGNEFTLSGADAENLLYDGRSQIDATTFRYLYRGQLGVGKVTATFAAGAWADSAGNTGEAALASSR